MNIRDLRPGNLIRWVQTNEIVTVTGVFEDKREVTARKADGTNVEDIIDAFEGVALSVEALQKTNLKEDKTFSHYRNFSRGRDFEIFVSFEGDFFAFKFGYDSHVDLKYLHDLQNLYYWLSNKKELEIKL